MEIIILVVILSAYILFRILKFILQYFYEKKSKNMMDTIQIPVKVKNKYEGYLELGYNYTEIKAGEQYEYKFNNSMITSIRNPNTIGIDIFIADEKEIIKVYLNPFSKSKYLDLINKMQYSNFEIRMNEKQRYAINKFNKKYYFKLYDLKKNIETDLMNAILFSLFFYEFTNWKNFSKLELEFEEEILWWKKNSKEYNEILKEFNTICEELFSEKNRFKLFYCIMKRTYITTIDKELIELEKQLGSE